MSSGSERRALESGSKLHALQTLRGAGCRRSDAAWRRLAVAVLLGAAVAAGAVEPHLASVLPTGGQRGTQVDVTFRGDRLQDTDQVVCYEPGLE